MNSLENAQPGDALVIRRTGYGETERYLKTVTRITKTLVICNKEKYNKSTGRKVGDSGYFCAVASLGTPEEIEEVKAEILNQRKRIDYLLKIRTMPWSIMTTDTLGKILEIASEDLKQNNHGNETTRP